MIKMNNIMKKASAERLTIYLESTLRLLYSGKITGKDFIEVEEEIINLINNETGFLVTFGDKVDGLPVNYILISEGTQADCVTFNNLIKNNVKLRVSIDQFINRKGYHIDLFKLLSRTSSFNSGKRVRFEGTKEGTVYGYYLGNDRKDISKAFPLKYSIRLDDGSTTAVKEDSCTLI